MFINDIRKTKEEIEYTFENLVNYDIYKLRSIGRMVGVHSPTTLRKEILINNIIENVYGDKTPVSVHKGRGRPVREPVKTSNIFEHVLTGIDFNNQQNAFLYNTYYERDEKESKPIRMAININSNHIEPNNTVLVASPRAVYVNDSKGNDDAAGMKKGIVIKKGNQSIIKCVLSTGKTVEYNVQEHLIEQHKIKPGDYIEFIPNTKHSNVALLMKVNENIMLQSMQNVLSQSNFQEKLALEKMQNNFGYIENMSNIILCKNKGDVNKLSNDICADLVENNYAVVKVGFDKLGVTNDDVDIDEYLEESRYKQSEVEITIDSAINRATFLAKSSRKVVVIISKIEFVLNLDYDSDDLEHNCVQRLFKLPKVNRNITVIGYLDNYNKETLKKYNDLIDNIY